MEVLHQERGCGRVVCVCGSCMKAGGKHAGKRRGEGGGRGKKNIFSAGLNQRSATKKLSMAKNIHISFGGVRSGVVKLAGCARGGNVGGARFFFFFFF